MSAPLREMLSVGIDVGTTTTQIVFSRLVLQDVARPGQVPRIQVEGKSVLYQSPIYFTPLISPEEVDTQALKAIVAAEYEKAGYAPEQVETGAVIVTGEIARTRNADAILQTLSDLAGDFVVTVAGPNVESIIAGRGSGASAYSSKFFTQVTHVDIGGGTANAVIFRIGEFISASAMAVGGRQLIIDKATGIVSHIPPPGRIIIDDLNLRIQAGSRADLQTLTTFCNQMADFIADLVFGVKNDSNQRLYLSAPLNETEGSRVLMFSGGVGAYFYHPIPIENVSDVLVHNDVGPLFAQSLRMNPRLRALQIVEPEETLRATVMGAASQTITLSGSTIWAEKEHLPLRNLPVARARFDQLSSTSTSISEALQATARVWNTPDMDGEVAIALDLPKEITFDLLQVYASGVVQYAQSRPDPLDPVVLIFKSDYAQVLGQTIKALNPALPVIVIDQVGLEEGDYIDLGLPILGGRVVPLSVKTLVFYH